MIDTAKSNFYQGKVAACMSDTRKLFAIVNGLLGRTTSSPVPSLDNLAERFSDYFVEDSRNPISHPQRRRHTHRPASHHHDYSRGILHSFTC
jgi:hypothetical protein